MKKKTIPLWVCVNKNNSFIVHASQPIRDEDEGIWVSRNLFVNCELYEKLKTHTDIENLTWESEPEFIEIEVIHPYYD